MAGVEKDWSFRQGCYGINEYNEKKHGSYLWCMELWCYWYEILRHWWHGCWWTGVQMCLWSGFIEGKPQLDPEMGLILSAMFNLDSRQQKLKKSNDFGYVSNPDKPSIWVSLVAPVSTHMMSRLSELGLELIGDSVSSLRGVIESKYSHFGANEVKSHKVGDWELILISYKF